MVSYLGLFTDEWKCMFMINIPYIDEFHDFLVGCGTIVHRIRFPWKRKKIYIMLVSKKKSLQICPSLTLSGMWPIFSLLFKTKQFSFANVLTHILHFTTVLKLDGKYVVQAWMKIGLFGEKYLICHWSRFNQMPQTNHFKYIATSVSWF